MGFKARINDRGIMREVELREVMVGEIYLLSSESGGGFELVIEVKSKARSWQIKSVTIITTGDGTEDKGYVGTWKTSDEEWMETHKVYHIELSELYDQILAESL